MNINVLGFYMFSGSSPKAFLCTFPSEISDIQQVLLKKGNPLLSEAIKNNCKNLRKSLF